MLCVSMLCVLCVSIPVPSVRASTAHASEPDALPTLHAIVGYVTSYFGCSDCVGHFAVIAARLESDIRELSTHAHHGGRERAALWLWQAHNKVNDRLAAEMLVDSPQLKFAEFAKIRASAAPLVRAMLVGAATPPHHLTGQLYVAVPPRSPMWPQCARF